MDSFFSGQKRKKPDEPTEANKRPHKGDQAEVSKGREDNHNAVVSTGTTARRTLPRPALSSDSGGEEESGPVDGLLYFSSFKWETTYQLIGDDASHAESDNEASLLTAADIIAEVGAFSQLSAMK